MKKQNKIVSSMTWVALYKYSRFLILLEWLLSFDDDDNPDVGVFLLLNTWNLCTRVYGSSACTIKPSINIVGTSISSLRIRSILIHLTFSWSIFHCKVFSYSKITSLLIITFFVMGLYNLYPILLSPYLIKIHFSLLSLSLILLASGIFPLATQPTIQRWVTLGLWPLHVFSGVTTCKLLLG